MTEDLFRYISPDPQAQRDDLPESPFWHIPDILRRARRCLRRRSAEAVNRRATVVVARILEFRTLIEEHGILSEMKTTDDVTYLGYLMLARTGAVEEIVEGRNHTDEYPEPDWVDAEDLAVLALAKTDSAVGHVLGDAEDRLIVAAQELLDAYSAVGIAERFGGHRIMTLEEAEDWIDEAADYGTERVSQTNSDARYGRGSFAAEEELSAEYREAKRKNPSLSRNKYAREIADKIVKKEGVYAKYRDALYGQDPARTLRKYFKKTDELMSSQDAKANEILASLAKDCTLPKKDVVASERLCH